MNINSVTLRGYRNFADATVKLAPKTLFIGANDVGKTNLLHAIRLLLDRSLPENDLEPRESDFHVPLNGSQAEEISIELKLDGITEDAVISQLKGHVSDGGETVLVYSAQRGNLSYNLQVGHSRESCEEIDGRYYLKHIHFKFVESCRDIDQYIQREKRYLLKSAKQKRTPEQESMDAAAESALQDNLDSVNTRINQLTYVSSATSSINNELKKISRHHAEYSVGLETQALNFSAFVERLQLGATSAGVAPELFMLAARSGRQKSSCRKRPPNRLP